MKKDEMIVDDFFIVTKAIGELKKTKTRKDNKSNSQNGNNKPKKSP